MIKICCTILLFSTILFSYEKSIDSQNVYYSSTHFRVVAGVYYKDSSQIEYLSSKLLDYAEESWQKEIVELGFKIPKNADIKKIDIYIANKKGYNYETYSTETISSSFAGYATSYPSDSTPYFVMNPNMSDELFKVTIAHEFFHTIQYSYFDPNPISDSKWFSNIWWLEATAVLMEDEVYDDIDDYIYFMSPFFNSSNLNFEIYDGTHEYSMSIFSKYIKERFGMELIKETLIRFEDSGENIGFFEIIDEVLKEQYSSSIDIALREFYRWVDNPSYYYQEGENYPTLRSFSKDDNIEIAKGGFAKIDNIQSGWSMVALPNDTLEYIDDDQTIFSYTNEMWSVNKDILDLNTISSTNSSSGYWVYSNNIDSTIYGYFDKSEYDDLNNLKKGWNFISFTQKRYISSLDEYRVVWHYTNSEWYAYSKESDLSLLGISELDSIETFKAYWIYVD